ncbi:MAG: type I-E CRISPR-associated protein Cse2/CasB [Holophaga sp.]|nr:type I-E CRISPR-associated protein Cse2/CasB [Holophaga sp.]
MNGFLDWLETKGAEDNKVRAVLRRSLAFEPGKFVEAYPYVEPFVKDEASSWRREMHYLVAGLWAFHWAEGRTGPRLPLGKACAAHQAASGAASTERRFIALLDADPDQLPHRLRQMVALLKNFPLDFEGLLTGLLYWNDDQKRTQNQWARDFYRNLDSHPESQDTATKETAK